MVDPQLIAYVQEQRAAGYSDEQISYVLIQQGYPQSLVQAALNTSQDSSKKDKRLLHSYIRDAQSRGVSEYDLRQDLMSQGYPERVIDKALAPKHDHHVALFIFPILAIIVLVTGYFFLITPVSTPPSFPTPQEPIRYSEIILQVLDTAAVNPRQAFTLCESVVERDRPNCFFDVSEATNNPSTCSRIGDDAVRDECFLQFIYQEKYELCSQVTTNHARRYCQTVSPDA